LRSRLERGSFPLVIARRTPESHDPITWIGRLPVYVTTLIVGIYVAAMIALTLTLAAGGEAFVSRFTTFSSGAVLEQFEIWRCLSYALPGQPDPWFIVSLVVLYIFGRDLEQYLGRGRFLRLYFGFLLLGPVLLMIGTLITGQSYALQQSWANLAVFLAFASLYPGAQLIFQIPAKIFAWILLGVAVLQLLAGRNWPDLLVLGSTSLLAWYGVREPLMPVDLKRLLPMRRRPNLRLLGDESTHETDPAEVIDRILEKISRRGLASLSVSERKQLEHAREALLAKDK